MLEVFGRGYVIEHCMSSFSEYNEEYTYRIYVTDLLRSLTGDRSITRYYELITPRKGTEKSATQVKEQIKGRFR